MVLTNHNHFLSCESKLKICIQQLTKDITELHNSAMYIDNDFQIREEPTGADSDDQPPPKKPKLGGNDPEENTLSPNGECDSKDPYFDEGCDRCKNKYVDPKPERLIMYLHALSYEVSLSNITSLT